MVSAELFEALEMQTRAIMGNELPFGGVQLLLSGDYYQCVRRPNPPGQGSSTQPCTRPCAQLPKMGLSWSRNTSGLAA